MRVAVAQIQTPGSDFGPTADRIVAASEQAASQDVGLLVLPACALTTPAPVPYVERQGYMMDLAETVVDLAERVKVPTVLPVIAMVGEDVMPEAMLLDHGEALPLRFSAYAKSLAGGDPDDAEPGAGDIMAVPTFSTGGFSFAVAFDYDEFEDLCDYQIDLDAVIYLPTYGYAADDPASVLGAALAENRFDEDAVDSGYWVIAAGSLGVYDTQVFTGGSFVISPDGDLVASAPSFEEAFISAELTHVGPDAKAESLEPEVYNHPFFCWETLALGIRGFVAAQGKTDVALALDGTLASQALATLASDALGPTRVHVLLAPPLTGVPAGKTGNNVRNDEPGAWQRVLAGASRADACRRLAANLHVDAQERDPELVRATVVGFDAAHGETERVLAARHETGIAAVELADLAARTGSVVLSPTDKTYLALEAGERTSVEGALLPFGDLYRTDVLEMVRMRNTISPVIPDAGIAACDVPLLDDPSLTGLSPERRLRQMDLVLASRIEWERALGDLATVDGGIDFVQAVLDRLNVCSAGRTSAGVILEASSRPLADARRPFGIAWRDRARNPLELETPTDEEIEKAFRRYADRVSTSDEAGNVDDGYEEDPEETARREIGDLLGYLRDLADGMGAGPIRSDDVARPDGEGRNSRRGDSFNPFGPFGSSPFSEN